MSTEAQEREFERMARNYTRHMKNHKRKLYAVAYANGLIGAGLDVSADPDPYWGLQNAVILVPSVERQIRAALNDLAQQALSV